MPSRITLFVLCLLIFSGTVQATERILNFHSDITVHQDSSMTVRETIVVLAEGNKIRRGIYRDFPTTYNDRFGNRYRVDFNMIGVQRDGRREDYHTENHSNGIRIYFGNKNRMLPHGEHSYLLTYRTSRQLGFFEDHDELYWNVTGNGWDFPIDSAGASVRLPDVPAQDIRLEGYTGSTGSKAQEFETNLEDGVARFVTTRMLNAKSGLTIVTMWPKGYVKESSVQDEIGYLLQDNQHLFLLFAGLALIVGYYLVVWYRVGRDQEAGVIVPRYFPPKGFSPASMRFIRERGYDHKTFACALVNLAVKGIVEIDESDGKFTLRKKSNTSSMEKAPGEKALLNRLLLNGSTITLSQVNHSKISAAISAHKKSLKRDYEKTYFLKNSKWIVPGALLSALIFFLGSAKGPTAAVTPAIFMTAWLSIWSTVCYFLFVAVFKAFRSMTGVRGTAEFVKALIFAAVFGFFEVMAIFMFTQILSLSAVLMLLVFVAVNVVFYHLLHADTRAGRKLIDQVEGFREYLKVAQGDELKFAGAPQKTAQLFETYLPFALALDVEQQWGERFASVFSQLEGEDKNYQPGWYRGNNWHYSRIGAFTSSMGSGLGSAISSSSTAPGSSSGGGGGGFSGGGGGGGGGGGW